MTNTLEQILQNLDTQVEDGLITKAVAERRKRELNKPPRRALDVKSMGATRKRRADAK